jgi:hypothetical protein
MGNIVQMILSFQYFFLYYLYIGNIGRFYILIFIQRAMRFLWIKWRNMSIHIIHFLHFIMLTFFYKIVIERRLNKTVILFESLSFALIYEWVFVESIFLLWKIINNWINLKPMFTSFQLVVVKNNMICTWWI